MGNSPRFFPGYETFLYVAYILNYTVRWYGLSNKVFMNKPYKTQKMSHNAGYALQDILGNGWKEKKEEMFLKKT